MTSKSPAFTGPGRQALSQPPSLQCRGPTPSGVPERLSNLGPCLRNRAARPFGSRAEGNRGPLEWGPPSGDSVSTA